jgi:glycosyltransferase involved in cell wall biosynthesis
MKIAIPYPEALPSKRARTVSVVNTARALTRGADVTVYSTTASADPAKIQSHYGIDECGLRFQTARRKLMGINTNGLFSYFLNRELRRAKPQIIYVRHLKTAAALIKQRVPGAQIVFECHEIFSQTTQRTDKRNQIAALESFVYGNVDGLVFINGTLQKVFRDHFPALSARQTVAYLGGPAPGVFPAEKDWSAAKELYYIGSFFRWKGAETLVRAMPLLPDLTAQLVGDDTSSEANRLRAIARNLGVENRVCFRGHITAHQVAELLISQTHFVVVPNTNSPYSNFTSPLKLFEAMAGGNVVVASDIPTIRELTHGGEGAALFEPENPDSLARCVRKWITNPQGAEMKARSGFELSKSYSWDRRAQVLLPFLAEVASR